MTEACQKGVRKVNENENKKYMKQNGDHHGYIEWIEKLGLRTYPLKNEERMKNGE